MELTDSEKAVLDGSEGIARQKAMELIVKYGTALGAKRLVDTNNVCGQMVPERGRYEAFAGDLDALYSRYGLDSDEVVQFPKVKAFTCQLETPMDPDPEWLAAQGKDIVDHDHYLESEQWLSGRGIELMCTCTPYQVGNVPVKGEHCAWMESSAVVYINSVLGARTNCEGNASAAASMLVGKTPYWGFHTEEHRIGTHLIIIDTPIANFEEWGLLGYYVGNAVGDSVPVLDGVRVVPTRDELKQFGAATASSGGVEMYHIPGVTAEARSVDEALGGRKPLEVHHYGPVERRQTYTEINELGDNVNVDFIMLGCPHYSIEQVEQVCTLLDGKHVRDGVNLWVFVPRALKDLANRNGYTQIIKKAGGALMSDSCPALGHLMPKGTTVMATDSAKQAHYLPSIMGIEAWYGTTKECIDAAINGRWEGELK